MVGADGFVTLALSNMLMLATGGVSWMGCFARVHRVARTAPHTTPRVALAMVLGFKLQNDAVSDEFACRLERARQLFASGRVQRILIVGGRTANNRGSEAEAGRRYLVHRGVPPVAIAIEARSRHTLENLRQARTTGELCPNTPFVLITSRYHLARSLALAEGMNLQPLACAAEVRLTYNPVTLLKLAREAYFLHWYHVGKTWSQWTGNRSSLARIM